MGWRGHQPGGSSADRRRDLLRALSWAAGVGLAASLLVAAWTTVRDAALERATRRDNALVVAAERLLSSLKDVETGERGLVITGKDQYLEPYNWGTAAAGPDLDAVRSLLGAAQGDSENLIDLMTLRFE